MVEDLVNVFDESNTQRLLNVGDQVAINYHSVLNDIVKVVRITKTLAILDNKVTLKRKIAFNGYISKHSTHLNLNRYTLATPEDLINIEKIKTFQQVRVNLTNLHNISNSKILKCSQETLDQLLDISRSLILEMSS